MNKIKNIAELLGITLDEEFKVDNFRCLFRLTKQGLEQDINSQWVGLNDNTLENLLNGKYTIVKLPWKPKVSQSYYVPYFDEDGYDKEYFCDNDNFNIEHNLAYRTTEEAKKVTEWLLEQIHYYKGE